MSLPLELTRGMLMRVIKDLDEKIADVQPEGLNNTIRWHIGHILTTAEQMMFGYPERSSNLPASYKGLFGMGSKPSEWGADIPTLQELIEHIETQTQRIREIPNELYTQKLSFQFPLPAIQTYGDMYEFMLLHEANHTGKIEVMKRILQR